MGFLGPVIISGPLYFLQIYEVLCLTNDASAEIISFTNIHNLGIQ